MATEELDDQKLIDRAVRGDRQAFGSLALKYASPLYTFLARRCGSRHGAEDLAQSTLLRAWIKLPMYRPDRGAFLPWLLAIANNLALSEHRRRRVAIAPIGQEPTRCDPDVLLHAETRAALWSLVDRVLAPEAAAAVWLRYGENLDVGDIAQVLGWTGVRVRVVLFRSRRALAAALSSEESAADNAPDHGERAHAL